MVIRPLSSWGRLCTERCRKLSDDGGKGVRDSIALGVIPNGVMNDFARFWDFDENDIVQTIEWLLKRRIRKVDLGCIRYTNARGKNAIAISLTALMSE